MGPVEPQAVDRELADGNPNQWQPDFAGHHLVTRTCPFRPEPGAAATSEGSLLHLAGIPLLGLGVGAVH
jgi:hypothetical protein